MTDLPLRMDAQHFVQMVIDALNRALDDNPDMCLAELAVEMGYRANTLQHFRSGKARSVRLAQELCGARPEIFEGLHCPCCGRLPVLSYSRTGYLLQ